MVKLKTEEQMRQVRADSTKETSIENYFVARARLYGCKQRKNTPFYAPDGWPDRLIIWPDGHGTTDWVELKRPKGGRYSTGQLRVMGELRACGCNVLGLHTKAAVDDYYTTRAEQLGVKRKRPGSKAGLARLKQLQEELT